MDLAKAGSARRALAALAVLCLGVCSAASAEDAADAPVQAIWAAKQLRFTYMGFTSHYSCDGLRDKLRTILLDLGARPDLKLSSTGCTANYGRPDPFPGVSGTLHLPEPVGDKAPPAGTQTVSAHWKSVAVAPRGDPLNAAGDCELTEQIKQRILPLFTTRNVEYSSNCIPHQLQPGGTKLKADVLFADQKSDKAP
jgi:hypothetical protein